MADFSGFTVQRNIPTGDGRKHVHILISPLLNPGLVYEEIVPNTPYTVKKVVEYYKERGWDVLVIPDEEVCGAIPSNG